jgi:hypothetical protein
MREKSVQQLSATQTEASGSWARKSWTTLPIVSSSLYQEIRMAISGFSFTAAAIPPIPSLFVPSQE